MGEMEDKDRKALAGGADSAYNRLFQEAGKRRERQEKRAKLSNFTFQPQLISRSSGGMSGFGNIDVEFIGGSGIGKNNSGERLYRQAKKSQQKAKEREQLRAKKETLGCTFKPTLITSKNRPTRKSTPISSPYRFERRIRKIFNKIDIDQSGLIDIKELKRALREVPELSEIIAPSKWKKAYVEMEAEASRDGINIDEFAKFCKTAASLRQYDTFERRCRLIFDKIDRDGSGRIDSKEVKRAIIDVPELSELLSRRAFTENALKKLTERSDTEKSANCEVTQGASFAQFLAFCKKGASLDAYKVDSPIRSGERMQREAIKKLQKRDMAHAAHIRKKAADIDAECTFKPILHTQTSGKDKMNNGQSANFGARMYERAKASMLDRDSIVAKARLRKQLKDLDDCSFVPTINRGPKPTKSMASMDYMSQGKPPEPPGKPISRKLGKSSRAARAARATKRLYAAAQAKQKRIHDREEKRIRMEGDNCTFAPEITDLGKESRGTRYRKAPRDAPASERLYKAAAIKRKDKDEIHKINGGMAGAEDEFTFCPEISPRSKMIDNEADFAERLYEAGKTQLAKRIARNRRPQFSFSPKIKRTREKPKFYNAATNVHVPQNNFGLPSDNRTKSKGHRIFWSCDRDPVPVSPVAHSIRLYNEGIKKIQRRDEAFLLREMNKNMSSCTFMPSTNNPSVARREMFPSNEIRGPSMLYSSQSATNPNQGKGTQDLKRELCDASTQAGDATIGTAHKAATRLQSFGRSVTAKNVYTKKKLSATNIQKVIRGTQHRSRAHSIRLERQRACETAMEDEARIRELEGKKLAEERRAVQEEELRVQEEEEKKKIKRIKETQEIIAKVQQQKDTEYSKVEETQPITKHRADLEVNSPSTQTIHDTEPISDQTNALEQAQEVKFDELQDNMINQRQHELVRIHELIGKAYAGCIESRRKSRNTDNHDGGWGVSNDEDSVLNPFPDWFQDVFMASEAEQGFLTADVLVSEIKQLVRKFHADSCRIHWFGVLMGWLQTDPDTPFSTQASDALIEVLITGSATDSKLLCERPCLVKEGPFVSALKNFFAQTENEENEEVVSMMKTIANKFTFQNLVDLDKAIDIFLTTWYSILGRFKAAWADDMPPASASPNGPG